MPAATITRCPWSATGYLLTVVPTSGRPISNRTAGHSVEEAAAELANAMIRYRIYRSQVIAPPEILEIITRMCRGRQRIR